MDSNRAIAEGLAMDHSDEPPFDLIRVRHQPVVKACVEPLHDEQGLIPKLTPPAWDEHGRPVRFTPEEIAYRSEVFRRRMKAIDATDQDPPGSDEEFMRGIDSHRPEGAKLFDQYYGRMDRASGRR